MEFLVGNLDASRLHVVTRLTQSPKPQCRQGLSVRNETIYSIEHQRIETLLHLAHWSRHESCNTDLLTTFD